jgi:DNA-directed RNA polymerase alpha subunit
MNKNQDKSFLSSISNMKEIKEKEINQFSSEFVLSHLPTTLATTIGNSLRRLALQFLSS